MAPDESSSSVLSEGREPDTFLPLVPVLVPVVAAAGLSGSGVAPAEAMDSAPVKRGVSTKVSISIGVTL